MADTNVYDIGDRIILRLSVKDTSGALVDPATLVYRVKRRYGTPTDYPYNGTSTPIRRVSLGVYEMDLDLTEADIWYWKATTTSPNLAQEVSVVVQAGHTA